MKNLIEKIINNLKFKFPYDTDDYLENLYVENYHNHKDYSNASTADSAESIKNYAIQTINYKSKCLFSGDHGNQGNQFEVYKVANEYNLKYRHSTEAYWVKDRLKEYPEIDKETGEYKKDAKTGEIKTQKDRTNCHICLIATNPEGREDINFILSRANEDGYYYKPRIDLELLFSVPKENIIVTSACFEKNTKVLTKNEIKNIQDVKSGDLVLTHKGTWEKVIVPTKREYSGKMYNLFIEGCFESIKCTKDHKFPTIRKTHSDVTKQIIWKKAEELTTEDRILSAIDETIEPLDYIDVDMILENYRENCNMGRPSKSPIIKSKIEVDDLFLQVLGLYTAEGNINIKNNYICFTLNKKETYLFDIINKFSLRYLNKEAIIQDKKETNGMSVLIHSKEMSLLFSYLIPSGVSNKKVPNFVLRLSPSLQMEYIKGLFLGDGHVSKNLNRVNYVTVSEQLGYEVGYILERNGLKSCCSTRSEKIDKNNIHHKKCYIVEVNNKEFYEYWKSYLKLNEKYNFNPNGWNSKKPVSINGVNYIHRRVRKIETYQYNDYVHCLSVENTHSFRVEGISVHNCIAGWKYEDAEDIWLKIHNYFGNNFFLEVQSNNTEPQKKLNEKIIELSKKYNIQIICGLDSHYVKEENSIKRDQILKYKNISYEEEQGWYLDYPDGKEIFNRFKKQGILTDEEILTAMMNTNVFVNECTEIIFDKTFKIPCVYPNTTYEERVKIFKKIINEQYKKEKLKSPEKVAGIKYEVGEYVDSGVVDYPLTNYHIIFKAVNEKGGILTTTSRGSSASFVTNKLLGFTTIDRFNCEIPIYPERFLTKDRVLSGQMPDIDFNVANPEPFVEATRELIGYHSCYPLMAIEKLKEKAAWQLYAGANDVDPQTANEISKHIDKYNEKLKYADEEDKEFIHIEDFIPEEYLDTYKKSLEYQGITINLKVHACFTKDHLVMTRYGYKPIQDIKIGDFVLSHDNTFRQVAKTMVNPVDKLIKIKITGENIITTENHPFYVISNIGKIKKEYSEPYWKAASEITKKDWIGFPINNNSIVPTFVSQNKTWTKQYLDFNELNTWWIIGRYIGDGWTENPRKNANRVIICCGKKDFRELDDIKKHIPLHFTYWIEESNTTYKIHFDNKCFFDYLQQFGKYAHGKKLTSDIFNLPVELLKSFLEGYFSADGHIDNNNSITFKTVSRELAYGLQTCIHKVYHMPCTIGIIPAHDEYIEGRLIHAKQKYTGKFKLDIRKTDVNTYRNGLIWIKVKDIMNINQNENVYNLTVHGTHSYTVNNMAVHNCGYLLLEGDIRRKIGLISAVSETTKKRTLCACIEGNYLDEFGYVKNDYLTVDSVHLTYKFFKSINKEVPSFDELREMINKDKSTWDIYAKGITCCVNQVEKESTTKKCKQYKCSNLAESSAFIAGIRPGFKTLLGTFLSREQYTTGEPTIDKILEDSYHFMLYQESIMKVLSFLGLPMGEAYGVLKAISKKKLKGEKSEKLKKTLKSNWIKIIGNLDNFDKIWNVIEDSSRYAFNAPHALSMGGDSAYQAWFKAHHTSKFYEVAINHYQDKNKKDKIDSLVKEALTFYEYKLGDYEFGKDNRRVTIDEKNKIIYPNLSSVKGFGEMVSEELFELGQKEYPNFSKVLEALKDTKINKTVLEKLVKLDYFKQFGECNYLLQVIKWNEIFKGTKEISKSKIEEYGLKLDFVLQYGNETTKKITKLRSEDLLNDIIKNIKYKPLTIKEKLDNQKDILGIITYFDKKYSSDIYYISELEVMKSIVRTTLYEIKSGISMEVKMWTNVFNKNEFDKGDFLYIKNIESKPQKEPTGEINPDTGKKIYRDIDGMFELWISKYQNITNKFEGDKLC